MVPIWMMRIGTQISLCAVPTKWTNYSILTLQLNNTKVTSFKKSFVQCTKSSNLRSSMYDRREHLVTLNNIFLLQKLQPKELYEGSLQWSCAEDCLSHNRSKMLSARFSQEIAHLVVLFILNGMEFSIKLVEGNIIYRNHGRPSALQSWLVEYSYLHSTNKKSIITIIVALLEFNLQLHSDEACLEFHDSIHAPFSAVHLKWSKDCIIQLARSTCSRELAGSSLVVPLKLRNIKVGCLAHVRCNYNLLILLCSSTKIKCHCGDSDGSSCKG